MAATAGRRPAGRTRWSSGSIRRSTTSGLTVANDCVRAGARFIATNRDPVYPTERAVRPGAGSIVAAIEAASGVTPISIGKPEPYLLEEAARAVGREPAEAVMIGDGLGTDIAAAVAVGARSILMLTGVTTRAEADARPAGSPSDGDRRRRGRARGDPRAAGCRPARPASPARRRRSPPGARGSRSSTKAWSSAARSIAQSSSAVSPISSSARSYSSVSDRSETVVSSVESVTGTPARCRRARGCAAIEATIPACQFEVGQRSRETFRAISSRQRSGSSIALGPWAIRSGSTASARRTWAAPPHSPAWTVTCRPPSRATANAAACRVGSGNASSGPARSQPVRPSGAEPDRRLGERDVVARVVRAHRRADQADVDALLAGGVVRAARHRLDHRPPGRGRARCGARGAQRISR